MSIGSDLVKFYASLTQTVMVMYETAMLQLLNMSLSLRLLCGILVLFLLLLETESGPYRPYANNEQSKGYSDSPVYCKARTSNYLVDSWCLPVEDWHAE